MAIIVQTSYIRQTPIVAWERMMVAENGTSTLDLDRAGIRPRTLIDPFHRAITYLRVSVTDRCDFRCVYCMSEHMTFLPKAELLSLEELDRLCSAFIAKGVSKLRLTGGEPLVRRGIMTLVSSLSRHLASGALKELTLTSNGSQLEKYAAELKSHGVERINVSLDTLNADKFRAITRWGELGKVLAGIDAALACGLKVKINAVALKGVNDNEIGELLAWAHGRGMDLTVIEVMPLGDIGEDRLDQYMPLSMVRARLAERYTLEDIDYRTGGPARYVRVKETGGRLGFITPMTHNFCEVMQSRAHYLHRHALYVPWPKRRRRSAQPFARLRKRRSGACRDRRGDCPQAQGARFRDRSPPPASGARASYERDRRLGYDYAARSCDVTRSRSSSSRSRAGLKHMPRPSSPLRTTSAAIAFMPGNVNAT